VLIPCSAVAKINSPDKQIILTLTRAEVERSPLADSADIEVIETLGPTIL
jgi:hypothetical protein